MATNDLDEGDAFPFKVSHPHVGTFQLYTTTWSARVEWCSQLSRAKQKGEAGSELADSFQQIDINAFNG